MTGYPARLRCFEDSERRNQRHCPKSIIHNISWSSIAFSISGKKRCHCSVTTEVLVQFHSMGSRKIQQLFEVVRHSSFLRGVELTKAQIPRNYLRRLEAKGFLQRIDRGLYSTKRLGTSEYDSLLAVSRKAPRAVVCLLSALQFHKIRTQLPLESWIAVDVRAWSPRIKRLPVRVVRLSGMSLHFGIEEHTLQGLSLRVFSPAKTVADCFKFRRKVGIEVAVDALRECLRLGKATVAELHEAAKICRVRTIMEPYLNSVSTGHP